MGHEAIGIAEEVGKEGGTIKAGQLVIMRFAFSDGSCRFCEEGLPTACVLGEFFGTGKGAGGAQAKAWRIGEIDSFRRDWVGIDSPLYCASLSSFSA